MELAQMFKGPGRDMEAVKKVFYSLFTPLCYCAQRITGNASEAEDIAMNTLEKLLKDETMQFENENHVKLYAKKMVVRAALDYARKQKVRKNYEYHVLHTGSASEEILTERVLYESEVIEIIYREIENLPRQTREVFKMVYLEKMDRTEVAEKLKISVNTVHVHCSNAIRELRQVISERELMVFLLFMGLGGVKF